MATRRSTRTTTSEDEQMTTDTAPDQVTEAPAGADPFALFDTINFPGRGRAAETGDMDERIMEALDRRKQYMAQGIAPEKILTVVDLTTNDQGEPATDKDVESFRNKLTSAVGRVAPDFKLEWRAVPAKPEQRRQAFVQYERAFGTEIDNATHVFRLKPKNDTDPHRTEQVTEQATDTPTDA